MSFDHSLNNLLNSDDHISRPAARWKLATWLSISDTRARGVSFASSARAGISSSTTADYSVQTCDAHFLLSYHLTLCFPAPAAGRKSKCRSCQCCSVRAIPGVCHAHSSKTIVSSSLTSLSPSYYYYHRSSSASSYLA